MKLSTLHKKLLRDVWGMKGQAFAIAMVVAAGIAMYVMYLSCFDSLRTTQRTYYAAQRFADVFASLERAPRALLPDIAALPGVSALEARVVSAVTLDLEQLEEPAAARLVSLPRGRRPAVNDLILRRGRWLEPGRSDEVLASESFVEANGLLPGERVRAIINGRLRQLTIVGVVLSPEYVYSIRPGEIVPDARRFGIFWMDERALAAAFDMEGAFNDVALALAPGASVDAVLLALDRILAPYGGLGAIPRELQLSHWTLESELRQLQTFGFLLPLVFLAVAAFILNVALGRALALQRSQIACLKALGYGDRAIGWHYLQWALLIGLFGALLGIAFGAYLGGGLIRLYNDLFRFPDLRFRVPFDVALEATALTLGAAGAGAFGAVRRAVRVPPAEAMRPEAPARYRRSWLEAPFVARYLGSAGRMVLRNVVKSPLRMLASVLGIGFAVAILMVGLVFTSAIDRLIQLQFYEAERQDLTLTFVEPRPESVRFDLLALPGVVAVELERSVAARIRSGHRDRYLSVTGVTPDVRFKRVVDREGRPIPLPPAGLVLSRMLGDVLGVAPGDIVRLELLEGRRPAVTLPVTALVDDVLGLSAYLPARTLHALMHESPLASSARLAIDPRREAEVAARLKELPAVAGSAFRRTVLSSFREVMAANMDVTIFINVLFAAIIAMGVVYNAARISLSERSHELASLRVLGFTRGEISLILLGELAVLTALALPPGVLMGYGLTMSLVASVESEVYRFPLHVSRPAVAWACLGIMLAALLSGLLVRRKLDRLDLIAVLKVRE